MVSYKQFIIATLIGAPLIADFAARNMRTTGNEAMIAADSNIAASSPTPVAPASAAAVPAARPPLPMATETSAAPSINGIDPTPALDTTPGAAAAMPPPAASPPISVPQPLYVPPSAPPAAAPPPAKLPTLL